MRWPLILPASFALALVPPALAAAPPQDAPPPTAIEKKGIATVQDAIEALKRGSADGPSSSSKGAAAPVPVGNAGQWFSTSDYPAPALRAGQQGRVIARVSVDAGGHPIGCRVAQSSGSPALDEATCRIAQAKMTFRPARDDGGHAVAGEYPLSIRWSLPEGSGIPATLVTTLVSIGEDGAVLSCNSQSAVASLDLCAAFPVGKKVPGLDAMKGKVVVLATFMRPLAE